MTDRAVRRSASAARSFWGALPLLTLIIMIGPVLAGLFGTVLPAFGYLPAAGLGAFSIAPFTELFAWNGIWAATRLSVTTGFAATFLSLAIVTLLMAGWSGTRAFRWLETLLSPLLSVPHAATAFGIAFLIAPSGWIARMISPWLTGWERPPDVLITQDPLGIALTLGLVTKEVPFLLLMALAAKGQSASTQRMRVAQSLGYGRVSGWLKSVFPVIYAQIRLPVLVVLAYSMSVVDVAMILGPTTPPPLSVQVVKWMSDPDLSKRLIASAAALWQLTLVIVALGVWWIGERITARLGLAWVECGARNLRLDKTARPLGITLGTLSALSVLLGLLCLGVWSIAGFWGYPDTLPQSLTPKNWARHWPDISDSLITTLLIAALSVVVAIALVIGCLEAEHRTGRSLSRKGLWLIYAPLLIPQIAFLPGVQTALLITGATSGLWPVTLMHVVFVFPYVFLSLTDPWRNWDPRIDTIARSLGTSPARVLFTLRLPMLFRPILTAAAVGFAVSVGQYLPTLLAGGGRVATLTTEAVALSSGGDRRAIGAFGVMQTLAVIAPFAIATLLPYWMWRNRKGLHG